MSSSVAVKSDRSKDKPPIFSEETPSATEGYFMCFVLYDTSLFLHWDICDRNELNETINHRS